MRLSSSVTKPATFSCKYTTLNWNDEKLCSLVVQVYLAVVLLGRKMKPEGHEVMQSFSLAARQRWLAARQSLSVFYRAALWHFYSSP